MSPKALSLSLLMLFTVVLPSAVFAKDENDERMEKKPEIRLMERNSASREAKVTKAVEKKKESRQNIEERIKENREESKEKFEIKRTAFKAKLETLKDEKKKKVAARVDASLTEINKKRTDKMSKALTRLEEFLTKLKEKAAVVKEDGENTTDAENAIALADAALEKAKTAVATQAGKEYIAAITDEATLGKTVGAAFKSLQADLDTTYKTISETKTTIVNVAKVVAKLKKIEPTEEVQP